MLWDGVVFGANIFGEKLDPMPLRKEIIPQIVYNISWMYWTQMWIHAEQ